MVPSGQWPHPAGSPCRLQAPNSHTHMLVPVCPSNSPKTLASLGSGGGRLTGRSHTLLTSLGHVTDPLPRAGWRAKRPGIEQRLQWKEEGVGGRSPG